ncbi:MAG: hypothetical protein AMJ69_05460 [Gammaproteobacteria bacterium SG8_47]|nr:MAG: hypothetical protein AMJ69_05460 [Gammaproteobacteria bacterium SG8_47]
MRQERSISQGRSGGPRNHDHVQTAELLLVPAEAFSRQAAETVARHGAWQLSFCHYQSEARVGQLILKEEQREVSRRASLRPAEDSLIFRGCCQPLVPSKPLGSHRINRAYTLSRARPLARRARIT